MRNINTGYGVSYSLSALKNAVVRFYQEYRFTALLGLVYGTILYSLMMTQQLTNTFDGLWLQNSHYAGNGELSSGRWMLFYLDKLVMGNHADPITSMAALALFIVGFLLVLDLFKLKSKLGTTLCLLLFISSTFLSVTLSYRFTSLGYGLAYLLAVLSVYAVIKIRNHGLAAGIAGVLLGLSLACYQAYLAVFCIIAVFYAIFRCKDAESITAGASSNSIVCYLLRILCSLCVGAIFYVASLSLCLKLHKVSIGSYGGFDQISSGGLLTNLLQNLPKTYRYFNAYFFMDKLKINRLQSFGIFHLLMALFIGVSIFIAIKAWKTDRKRLLLLLPAVALIPIASNAYMLIAGDKLELQMAAGLAMFAPLTMLLVFSCLKGKRSSQNACVLLCVALIYGNSIQVLVDQQGMYEGQNACDTMITQVIHDLNEENLLSSDFEYFFIGVPAENPLFYVSSSYDCANAYAQVGRFWVSGGCCSASYEGLINRRMGLDLSVSHQLYEDIADKMDVSEMPEFPADGYIALLDKETVVVKISEHKAYTGDSKYTFDSST